MGAASTVPGPAGPAGPAGPVGTPGPPVYASDTAPAGAPVGALWWESDTGILYMNYNDGSSTQWVSVAGVDTGLFVRKTGDTMTGSLGVKDLLQISGGSTAILNLAPGVGATKTGQIYQGGDTLGFASAGVLNWMEINLNNGVVSFKEQTPVMPTPAATDKTTKGATTEFVKAYAAPMDAMAYSGLQINGGMEVSQERGATGTSISSQYVVDGWMHAFAGGPVLASQQYPLNNFGIPNQIASVVTTPAPALAAGAYAMLFQKIEGNRFSRLGWGQANPQPLTVVFWTAHTRPGLYSLAIRNAANDRAYVATYNHIVASSYQMNVITIPGCADGVWPTGAVIGAEIDFAAGSGTTFVAPSANTWHNSNYIAAPGQINGVAAGTDVFRLAGVVLLPGSEAPPSSRASSILRPYGDELLICQRYYWPSNPLNPKGTGSGTLVGYSVAANYVGFGNWRCTVPMRAQPGLFLWNAGVQNQMRNIATGALQATGGPTAAGNIGPQGGSNFTVSSCPINIWWDFDLILDARL